MQTKEELLTMQAVRLLSALDSTQICDLDRHLAAALRTKQAARRVVFALYQAIHKLSVADAELVELASSVEGDPLLRRLALEALVQQDASPLVTSVAQFIFT